MALYDCTLQLLLYVNKVFKLILAAILTLNCVNTGASPAQTVKRDNAIPFWFNDVLALVKQKGCSEKWTEFYWANKLPPAKLKIGCMADGKMVVVPDLVAIDGPVLHYSAALPFDDELRTTIPSGAPHFQLEYFTDHRAQFNAKSVVNNIKNTEPMPLSGTTLTVISSERFSFCAIDSSLLRLSVWPQATPLFCGVSRATGRTVTSIQFAVDNSSSVTVWLPEGLPTNENPLALHAKILKFVQSFRKK